MSFDDDDWDEIYDEREPSTVVGKDTVVLRTKNRKFAGGVSHYIALFSFGQNVLKQLNWTDKTKLKFQWGKDNKLGVLRIAVVLNTSAGGWNPKIYASGCGNISNKALPPNMDKIDRQKIELVYSIEKDPREDNLYFIQITLPDDFYIGGIPKQTSDAPPSSVTKKIEIETPIQTNKTAPVLNESTVSKKDNNKTSTLPKEKTPYEIAVESGGYISREDLCKYLRVYNGDSANIINPTSIEVNGTTSTNNVVLAYANQHRRTVGKPTFSFTKK